MDSLQHYGFNMYPPYTQGEIALYRPSPIRPHAPEPKGSDVG